jgi:ribosome production factor 1
MAKKKAVETTKKPVNKAKAFPKKTTTRNPGHISNKLKRSEVYGKYLQEKKQQKKLARQKKEREAQALGDEVKAVKQQPKTLDNTREIEVTLVQPNDVEIEGDQADDEFFPYLDGSTRPKILITTRPRPSQNLFFFVADLQNLIPSLHFYPRKSYSLKELCTFAANRNFTHLIVLSEKKKQCNGMTVSHLMKHEHHVSAGPTAFFKVSNVVTSQNLPNHGVATNHVPELNLHGFGTRLGHRVGRFLASLFPHEAQLEGRQVVTFHNQRDYIFVRHHRYVFYEGKEKKETNNNKAEDTESKTPTRARLQELGPRFTIKLRWLQEGTFDTRFGEYEWIHKRKEMDTTRRRFHL